MSPEVQELKPGEVGVASGQGEHKGRILLVVPAGARYVAMDPGQACAVGKDMIDKAVAAGAKVELILPKREIKPMVRTMLKNRVSLVMRGELEKGRKADHIAEMLVDIVLREAL